MVHPQVVQVSQSAKLGLFLATKPASFSGVVAGTTGCSIRRWHGGEGRVSQAGPLAGFSASVAPGAACQACRPGRWGAKPSHCDPLVRSAGGPNRCRGW